MSQSFQIGGPLGSAGKGNAARAPQAHKQSEQQFASTMPQNKQIVQPTEFLFEYNFDEQGALYFLGSFGKKRLWQNPHALGQIQAFASSIGMGSVENFVGRNVVNCRTLDEPYSFYGVDLGFERRLLPTCYTLRNRNS